ncbi:Hypothetical protein NTJ_07151 [Nesidiocoris tenuis]|uniref:Uncharacterized protein n=1 Tax=Nesidiocoris tenuis TaxID=355587 RepID=A0ABN7AV72_9HEMI|nr:Hypothetical protein NTJ_07151 [Nesidiocoris tenuis]
MLSRFALPPRPSLQTYNEPSSSLSQTSDSVLLYPILQQLTPPLSDSPPFQYTIRLSPTVLPFAVWPALIFVPFPAQSPKLTGYRRSTLHEKWNRPIVNLSALADDQSVSRGRSFADSLSSRKTSVILIYL